jgi:teichuronic acid exporter
MGVKQKALQGGMWLAGFTTVSQAISWIATIGIANLLSPEDYGLMTMASFLTAYIEYLSEMGIGASVIQKNDINKRELSSLFWLSLFSGVMFSFVALCVVYPTAMIFHDKRIIPITALIAPIFLVGSISSIPNALLRRDLQFKYIGLSNMAAAVVSCLCQIYFASKGFGVFSLIWGTIILRTTKTIFICFTAKWVPLFHFSFAEVKPFLRFGINMAGGAFFTKVFETLDSFVVGNRFNAMLLGNYNFSASLASMPTDKIWPVFQQTLFPLLSRLQHDSKDRNKTLLNTMEYCAYMTFPLYLAGSFLAHDLVLGLLGEKWLPIVPFFRVFCAVKLIELLTNFCNLLFASSGKAKETLMYSILRAVIMPISVLGASLFGYKFIIVPWAIIYPILCISWLLYTLSYFEIKATDFFKTLYKPFLTSGVFIASCFLVKTPLYLIRSNFPNERLFVGSYIILSGIICLFYIAIFERQFVVRSFKLLKT